MVAQARTRGWVSDEHFTVDGTLLEAWAGAKSFQRKDGKNPPPPDDPGNPTVNFHGEKRSNRTHESTTDPEAKLARSLGLGLDQKAIEAVRQWKFEPAMKDGHPVAVQINVEVNFRLY